MRLSFLTPIIFTALSCLTCQSSPTAAEQKNPNTDPKPVVQPKIGAEPVEKDLKADLPGETDNETSPEKTAAPKPKRSPKIKFDHLRHNFGEIYHAEKVTHKFTFTNAGDRDLEILGARASCGCTTPSYPFIPIKPGDEGFIEVTYNSVGKQGAQKANIRVNTNDPNNPEVKLYLSGRVLVKPLEEKETG